MHETPIDNPADQIVRHLSQRFMWISGRSGRSLILGPIGALAGLLGAGHSSEMQVLVTMRRFNKLLRSKR